jgi:NAD(P)-dependent dehydrogenase (short-subunit alcohol dehydrogenase family)
MAEEKIAVVTGTTSGIGREIVRGLLEQGYTVVAHARSADKAEAELMKLDASQRSRVQRVLADLSSRKDVVRMADELATRFPKIHLLIHNAAVVPRTRSETSEGLELAFATNVLAPFILTRRLEASLKAGSARVELFWGGGQNTFDIDDLQSKKGKYDGWVAYCQSKNACALLAGELARRGKDSGVSYFGVLPGLVNTEGMRGLSNFVFSTLMRPLYRTPAEGARTALWVAQEPGLEARSGTIFGSPLGSGWRNETKPGKNATDPTLASRLYAKCEELAG